MSVEYKSLAGMLDADLAGTHRRTASAGESVDPAVAPSTYPLTTV